MKVLAPSLEALLGLKVTLGDDVADWVRVGPVDDREGWPTSPSLVVFQEATRPRSKEFEDGWNNLRFQRNVRASGARLSAFPIYKVEPKMEEGPVGLFPVLKTLLEEWDAGAPPHQEANMPDHQIRALKALGYLSD